ncbi:MAG: family four-helix-bundle protein, partial [Myxococcaceae bacterium]|nr:family four-helix-bundle protein [Myxococcaceae bacterium]
MVSKKPNAADVPRGVYAAILARGTRGAVIGRVATNPSSAEPGAAEHDRDALLATLNELADMCRQGERGWRNAATAIEEPVYRTLLECYADQRAQFVMVLETIVERLGGRPARRLNPVSAVLQRGLRGVRSVFYEPGDKGVLEACASAENAAKRVYEAALKGRLPIDLH